MADTYTVKWGDTLWSIASDNNMSYQTLAKINNIPITKKNGSDYALITVGQILKLSSGTSTTAKVSSTKVQINAFGLQSNAGDRDVYVTWTWTKEFTKEYTVEWSEYYNNYWHYTTQTTTDKGSEFTANANATSVRVRVKPVSTTYVNANGKEVSYWTNAAWTTRQTYSFSDNPPKKPAISNVTLNYDATVAKDKLTVGLTGITSDLNASIVHFNLIKDGAPLSNIVKVKVDLTVSSTVTTELTVELGSVYQVRVRTAKAEKVSAWTEYSDKVSIAPKPPTITKCQLGADDASIEIAWDAVPSATSYKAQYTQDVKWFDNPDNANDEKPLYSKELTGTTCSAILSDNVGTGYWYVRLAAVNASGDSDWSEHSCTHVDGAPLSPTSFTDKVRYALDEVITLKWIHNQKIETNSEKSSTDINQTYPKYSQIDLYVDDGSGSGFVRKVVPTIPHLDNGNEIEKYTEHSYSLCVLSDLSETGTENDYDIYCPNGCKIKWRVRTAEENGSFGDWSAVRTFSVYVEPTLSLYDKDGDELSSSNPLSVPELPLYIKAIAGPDSQKAIGYHIELIANKTYEILDSFGENIYIAKGQTVYSKYYDNTSSYNEIDINISAGDVHLSSNSTYELICTVAMDSGLTVSKTITAYVTWDQSKYYTIDAEIAVDTESYTASIQPSCKDGAGDLVEDAILFVYRREYDGSFTRISGEIDNLAFTWVTDPHPSLDYARYRIVAINTKTGLSMYSDLPSYPIGCKSIILQWNEEWDELHETSTDEDITWEGSLIKLPYNIDVQSKYSPDVAFVEYIGRKNPVSYYGTHFGETATWNVSIPKSDTGTIYALRRLSKWMGNVYVREPSGVGYWANVQVSFSIKHLQLTIPVTLNITRVEGGM